MFLVVKGFHEEEGRIRVLRGVVGDENGVIEDVFGEEVGGSNESKPGFRDASETNEGFRWEA